MKRDNSLDTDCNAWDDSNMSLSQETCQSLYYKLLVGLENDMVDPSTFVIHLYQTHLCDHLGSDLSQMRNEFINSINAWKLGSYKRFLSNHATEDDLNAVNRTKIENGIWMKRSLKNALSLKNWTYYQTIQKTTDLFHRLESRE